MSGALHYVQQLEEDARRATCLIQKLTSTKEEMRASLPKGTEPMPRSELHYCAGLAFTFVRKVGVGVSMESGHGFVISKLLPGDSATPSRQLPSWSPPMFVDIFAGGLGLTLGYSEIESVVVLDTPEAVAAFTKTQVEVDTDITGAVGGSVAAHLPATAANLQNLQLSDKTFSYSIAKGAILDVSLTGLRYGVDERMNQALYGPRTSPQAILEGAVEPPAPMQELYNALNKALNDYYAQAVEEDEQEAAAAAAEEQPLVQHPEVAAVSAAASTPSRTADIHAAVAGDDSAAAAGAPPSAAGSSEHRAEDTSPAGVSDSPAADREAAGGVTGEGEITPASAAAHEATAPEPEAAVQADAEPTAGDPLGVKPEHTD